MKTSSKRNLLRVLLLTGIVFLILGAMKSDGAAFIAIGASQIAIGLASARRASKNKDDVTRSG